MDWFIFENRIRKIIYEVINPISNKISAFEEFNELVRVSLTNHDKLFDDLKTLISQNNLKLNLLAEVQNRLGQIEHSKLLLTIY